MHGVISMKYKLLLAGHNTTIIDDFFYAMDNEFECLTTSNRTIDMLNHIDYFQPDLLIYCFTSETKEDILKLSLALEKVEKRHQKMIIIGSPECCDEFLRLNNSMVKLVIHRPVSAATIKEKLLKFFKMPEEATPEEATPEKPITEKKPETAVPEESRLKQILVIDDDTIMLNLIKTELKEHYNVATAVSGKIGLKFLERKPTDLVLLDYEMPVEDGPAVFEKIRANPATQDVPVIFLTGINDRDKIQKVLAMKPQGYLLKPIECEQLVKIIHQTIG